MDILSFDFVSVFSLSIEIFSLDSEFSDSSGIELKFSISFLTNFLILFSLVISELISSSSSPPSSYSLPKYSFNICFTGNCCLIVSLIQEDIKSSEYFIFL